MKVLYILNPTPQLSGSFKAFMVMLQGLMARGVEPYLVVPTSVEQDYEPVLRRMNLPLVLMQYKFHGYPHWQMGKQKLLFLPRLLARFYVNYRAERRLAQMYRNEGIALVHTNIGLIDVGRRVARRLGVPHVQHIREYGERQFPSFSAFVARMHQPGSYSICITRGVQHHFHLTDTPLSRVIYDGVHAQMTELPSASERTYLLFAGIVHLSKGIDQVIDAYCRYVFQGGTLPLWVAGRVADEALMQRLKAQLRRSGCEALVRFLGARTDVEDLMRGARAVIVASPVEGFGFCMPEAMFNGTLVIGRNVSGTQEQMDNGRQQTGHEIALRYETTDELADRLHQVTDGFPDQDAMRQRAFEVVNRLYSHEAHVRQVYQFYQDIVSSLNPLFSTSRIETTMYI